MNGFDPEVMKEVFGELTTVKYTWEMVLDLLKEPDFHFKRSAEGHYKYAKATPNAKQEWKDLDSYCKHTFLQCAYKTKQLTDSDGKTRTVKYVDCEDEDTGPTLTFCRNNYPYNLEPEMLHYCIWTTKRLIADECKALVEMFFPRTKYDIVIFENPHKLQSFPDIHHIQVIARPKKSGLLYVKIDGFEEKSVRTKYC